MYPRTWQRGRPRPNGPRRELPCVNPAAISPLIHVVNVAISGPGIATFPTTITAQPTTGHHAPPGPSGPVPNGSCAVSPVNLSRSGCRSIVARTNGLPTVAVIEQVEGLVRALLSCPRAC